MTKYLIQATAIILLVIGVSVVSNKIVNRKPATDEVASQPSKPIDADSREKLITAYVKSQNLSETMQKRELELCNKDADCTDVRAKLQAAVAETNRLADEVQRTKGYRPGTTFRVDPSKGTVDVSEPQATK